MEIGIYLGGSCAYLHALFSPEKLLTIDIRKRPVMPLLQYIEEQSIEQSLKPRWGVDQGNAEQLTRVIRQEFGEETLDLVIDDASHLLEPTRTSFNVLFPRLRPGAYYYIEDWKWANASPDTPTTGGKLSAESFAKAFDGQPPLSLLGVELLMACGNRPDIFAEVTFTDYYIRIKRGTGAVDSNTFNVRHYLHMMNIDITSPENLPW